jgi:phage/plasmid-like protein (TIGR03299 family)
MSHELEMNGSTASFAGASRAWHGLGVNLSRWMTLDEALDACFGNRELIIEEVKLPDGEVWANGKSPMYSLSLGGFSGVTADGQIVDIPRKRMRRIFSSKYEGFTPRELLEIVQEYGAQAGAAMASAGFIYDGTRFFGSMNMEPIVVDPNGINDVIDRYVSGVTSFDGSSRTRVFTSWVRVVCNNTLKQATAAAENVISSKHTRGAHLRMRNAAMDMAAAMHAEKHIVYQAEKLLLASDPQHKITHKVIDALLGELPEKDGRARTIAENKRDVFWEVLQNDRNVGFCGLNGWSIWNAAVEYLDHHAQVNGAENSAEKATLRAQRVLDGADDDKKQGLADLILSLA